jgi:hypothetical protein
MWIISESGLQGPAVQPLPGECPHCHVQASLTPVSTPDFATLQRHAPRRVGIVFHCDACGAPRFMRFSVRHQDTTRIELAGRGQELERAPERYAYGYLPAAVARLFREALACYASDCFDAFASMCRRAVQAAAGDLGEAGRMRMFDTLEEIIALCELDQRAAQLLQQVIFGGAGERDQPLPELDGLAAAMLLEAMKDLFYQTYIRREKLTRAMQMRRFFAFQAAPARGVPGESPSLDRAEGA